MDTTVRMYLAELFGTFLVVLIGAGTVCSIYLPEAQPMIGLWGAPLSVAVAEGIALGLAIALTAPLSIGCCNPAITVAMFVAQQLDRRRMVLLILVQLVGAFLAGLVVALERGQEWPAAMGLALSAAAANAELPGAGRLDPDRVRRLITLARVEPVG